MLVSNSQQTSSRIAIAVYHFDFTCLLLTFAPFFEFPGVFYGYFVKPKKDADPESNEFLLGSGMTVFPVTLSLTTSFITAIELLGNPSEMFFSGTQYALIGKTNLRGVRK